MMFEGKKTQLQGKEKRRRARFRSFGQRKGGGDLIAVSYRNCDCRDGNIRGGIGLKQCHEESGRVLTVDMPANTTIPQVFFTLLNSDGEHATTSLIYLVANDGYLYARNADSGVGVKKILVGDHVEHCALKGENGVIYNFFCGSQGAYGTTDGEHFTNVSMVECVGACICGLRYLILTKNGELIYTAALSPYEVDEKDPDGLGIIYLPAKYGMPRGIKAYENSAYIFFERGICKLTISASAKENTLKEIAYHGGLICPYGQAVTSEGILFLAGEGAYYLRNDHVERVCEYLPIGPCATEKAVAVGYCDDIVIFSYYKEKGTAVALQCVAVYVDGKDGYFTNDYGWLGGNAYTCINGRFYRYAKDGTGVMHDRDSFFVCQAMDFGRGGMKRLKSLTVEGEGQIAVGIKRGKKEKKYFLTCKDGMAKTRLCLNGREFSFAFYLETGAVVAGVEIEYLMEE